MANNRLNILEVGPGSPQTNGSSIPSRLARKKEMQAKFERLWLLDPEQFNPLRNCMQRERLDRTWALLTQHISLEGKHIADIGCGAGIFSRRMRDGGAHIEAVDIAENALKRLRQEDMRHIEAKQEAMPMTQLPDQGYDIVVCTEIVAELSRDDYRLFFAELARLVKPDGYIVCSTPIDIDSEGGVERLTGLAQTEFDIVDAKPSYHALFIRLKRWLELPINLTKAWQDPRFREEELAKRRGLSRWWFYSQTSFFFIWIWFAFAYLVHPLLSYLRKNRWLLLQIEKICQFIWDESGISHYIFLAKLRPLATVDPKEIPIEKPKRKEIWE
ncbi:class I SAM-dependent methyltransferase [Candidatus Protochlamydia phocaeensis]|uniref:class I SAM-dependent methyltransferase n=1 Tax=Candidatus Protochlamydia phocaeensis TaxID=1414722 RepID=UPI0008397079|nr:class I SAM-dependent methyltransferase [Candidatus Protochlamydia phocaeensis]